MDSKIIFHLSRHQLEAFSPEGHDFTANFMRAFQAQGVCCKLAMRIRGAVASDYDERDFHFIHQGRVTGHNILNVSLSYVSPFWYADSDGVMSFSSLGKKRFDPQTLPQQRIEAFHNRIVERIKSERNSKYSQPEHSKPLPQGSIAVFLQGLSEPVQSAQYMSEKDMLLSVFKHRAGRPVIIKHHPRNLEPEMAAWLTQVCLDTPDISVVDAHVHDMLNACDFSVSLCSGASFESLLLEKPTVVFGQTDYHHCAETVSDPSQVEAAFERVVRRQFPFKEYIFWHWNRHCINLRQKGRIEKVVKRMGARGFDVTQLGLERPE